MSIALMNGDCLERMKELPAASIDCFICDLPYGCLTGGGGKEKMRRRFINGKDTGQKIKQIEGVIAGCSWDIKIALEPLWEQIRRLRKSDHTPCLMFCTTKFGFELYKSNPDEFRYDLVWDKQRGVSFLSANKMPMRSHEMIYVFSKTGAYYNRVDISGNYRPSQGGCKGSKVYGISASVGSSKGTDSTTQRCALSVLDIGNFARKGNHPTEKPMELYKFLIERYCPVNGTMLDPTAGSFNSCFAAMDLNRHAIGIEKDEEFYKKACDRADAL
jgi:site-specific DNA-methyltransferase (adenine-specific)